MFWKKNVDPSKKPLNSDEYEHVLKRILEINTRIGVCESKIEILKTEMDNLRGNFNRKLKGIKEEEQKETQEINSSPDVYFG